MQALRPYEEWVRRILVQTLGVPVEQHDDGSRAAMYDLEILHPNGDRAPVEITAAADGDSITLWRLMNDADERWQVETLVGGWMVSLDLSARANRVRRELPDLLTRLEGSGIRELEAKRRNQGVLDKIARDLGVRRASQSGTQFPGSIYITLDLPHERMGGMVSSTGNPLSEWTGDFLKASERADVRAKLGRTNQGERHAVIVVPSLSTAPFRVTDLLMRDDAPHPTDDPVLPDEINHVWILSTWTTGKGFRWSPTTGWLSFEKAT